MMRQIYYGFEVCFKVILLSIIVFYMNNEIMLLNKIAIPMRTSGIDNIKTISIKEDLLSLGAKEKDIVHLTKAIKLASDATKINHKVLTALMYTESHFKARAISEKNYKGLMQTTNASFVYSEVDTLLGAKELENKLRITKGNLLRALTLYKGGNNPTAYKQAQQVMTVYKQLLG